MRSVFKLLSRRKRYLGMNQDRLVVCFAVPPGTPLLEGVEFLHTQAEEIAVENLSIPEVKPGERDFYAGYQACARDLQSKIEEWVEAANQAKMGVGKVDLPE